MLMTIAVAITSAALFFVSSEPMTSIGSTPVSIRAVIISIVLGSFAAIAFLWPAVEKVRKAIGSTAAPLVDLHNSSAVSHTDIRTAIALNIQTLADLQRQITALDAHRRENVDALSRQIATAIELLRDR